ncbi:MAG TPA: cell division protein SepF [Acidimicrobiales bacterium]|nr:cell division protein SepF [Acidimicrobiales bacterium]
MPSFVRRTMVYLGLVDDDYDEYEPYDEAQPAPVRAGLRAHGQGELAEHGGAIRTLARDEPSGVGMVTPRPQVVRPMTPAPAAKPFVVGPGQFADAQQIGDRFKASQPVIVNLQGVDRELSRRMIDFCSGLTYGLGGAMDKVADHVFLLTPSNVEVSAEERRRLHERNYRT